MMEFRFRLVVRGNFREQVSDEDLLDATDALGSIGCDDCSISVLNGGLELDFDRVARSLQEAIASAVRDVERAGYIVESIQMDRNAAFPVASE